ncbi:P-loop NTPase fold protein [Methanococcus maripaludis]|uniref:Putative KAP-like P-loop ATPase n=1 Tax=Methanococcus maripaludis TaxID=39152 RepID=A0A7J9PT51_METMI|nr:P-loop NTPase fold protein [Methanococcus maripaludis]MBA2868865.1 putative KAP-like P-loop ATPase [Methanococcus maripaludis]
MSDNSILKDEPISNFKDDLLGRGSFSRSLADRIMYADCENESLVIGLYGQWGSGKSSIINLMLEHIDECDRPCPNLLPRNSPIYKYLIYGPPMKNLWNEFGELFAKTQNIKLVLKLCLRSISLPVILLWTFFYTIYSFMLNTYYLAYLSLVAMGYITINILYYSNITDYPYNRLSNEFKYYATIKFEPWNYYGKKELISNFFEQLSISIRKNEPRHVYRKILPLINAYSEIIGAQLETFGIPYVTPLIKQFSKSTSEPTLEEQKINLMTELKNLNHKIVVIIDDIDRLPKSEIVEIFQLIKAVADFPNLVYVLSFDKGIIASALCDVQSIPEMNHDLLGVEISEKSIQSGSSIPNVSTGYKYIEKMIPVYFEIPEIDKNTLLHALNRKINSIDNDNYYIVNEEEFNQLWDSGLKYFFKNIRDVIRFSNLFIFNYPFIHKDVDIYDFISLTAIQTCMPELYSWIRDNEDYLVSDGYIGEEVDIPSEIKNELKHEIEKHDGQLTQISNNNQVNTEKVYNILKVLFPKMQYWKDLKEGISEKIPLPVSKYNYFSEYYGQDYLKKICGISTFSTYFNLDVPKNVVSNYMIHYLSEKRNMGDYRKFLDDVAKNGIMDRYYRDITLDISVINKINYGMLISTLFNMENLVLKYDREHLYLVLEPISSLIYKIIFESEQGDNNDFFRILSNAFDRSDNGDSIIPHFINLLVNGGIYQGNYFSENQVESLKDSAVKYLKKRSSDGHLENNRHIRRIVQDWCDWGTKDDINEFIKNIKLTKNLIRVISFVVDRSTNSINPNKMAYLDAEYVKQKFNEIKNSNEYSELSDKEKGLIDAILVHINKMDNP